MAAAMSSDIVEIEEAPWARWLVASKTAARIWLVARVWLGYECSIGASAATTATCQRSVCSR